MMLSTVKKGRLCQVNLLELMEYITDCIDKRRENQLMLYMWTSTKPLIKYPILRLTQKCCLGRLVYGQIRVVEEQKVVYTSECE